MLYIKRVPRHATASKRTYVETKQSKLNYCFVGCPSSARSTTPELVSLTLQLQLLCDFFLLQNDLQPRELGLELFTDSGGEFLFPSLHK